MSSAHVYRLGRIAQDHFQTYTQMATILARMAGSFVRLSFLNHAVYRVLVRQIYFTAVQALPVIAIAALILGSITVHYILSILTGIGSYDKVGSFLITAMLHEIAPMTCCIIMLLRSGTAIISEVALMKINSELDTLNVLGVSISDYLYLPRILAFALCGPMLTISFVVVGLYGGFFTLGYFHDITFDNYLDQLYTAVEVKNIVIVVLKPLFMAVAVALACLQKGLTVHSSFTEVPIKLIQGMMLTVSILVFIEVAFAVVASSL